MTNNPNPFSPPIATEAASPVPSQPDNRSVDFLPIMRRWERWRLIYNAALIVFTISIAVVFTPANCVDVDFWALLCVGGIIANVCFLVGPACEAYGTCFGLWHRTMTPILVVAGLLLTAIMAATCIFQYPNM